MRKYWTEVELKYLEENYCKVSMQTLQLNLPNRTKESIRLKANRLGFIKEGTAHLRKKVNSYAFSELTNEACYWAGFIAADGSLSSKRTAIEIMLSALDAQHLERFGSFLQYEGEVRYSTSSLGNPTAALWVCNEMLYADLISKFNLGPRKTYTLQPPPLTQKEHILSFLTGYVDGDGSIYINKNYEIPILTITATKALNIWFYEFVK